MTLGVIYTFHIVARQEQCVVEALAFLTTGIAAKPAMGHFMDVQNLKVTA